MKKMYSKRDFNIKSRTQCYKCFFQRYKKSFVLSFRHLKKLTSKKFNALLIFLRLKKEKIYKKPQTGPIYLSENTMKKKNKRHKKLTKNKWQKRFIFILKLCGILFAIGLLGIIGVFAYFAKDLPEPGRVNTRAINESTKIYDRTGTVLLYDIHGEEKRTIIPKNEIPPVIKQATIALEDHNFYHHHGFDVRGVINAVLSNIFHIGNGRGGSTITQQFVKNSILTNERSISRKIKELILAIEIELKFSKDDIISMYLNEIPYGSNAYGIEAASETFFGKHAKDLTLDEATILASLPKAPSRFSPYGSHRQRLKTRQEYALDQMASLGFISQETADNTKQTDVFAKLTKNTENIKAPHFVMYVRDYLEEKYGNEYLEKEGLRVITTLDWNKQQIAQQIVHDKALENEKKYNAENSALVAIDPKNGDILTMVGSRDYFDEKIDGQVNVAISDRQPGSSFKPYAYLYAFTKGYTPETILYDVETKFSNGDDDYAPKNYDGTFHGPLKMKKALGMSLNIPAVKTLYLAGPKEVIQFAKSLGITSLNNPKRYGLSVVLGGGEVKLVDHTAAFSVFANEGIKHDKRFILEIKDKKNNIIEKAHDSAGEQIVDKKYVSMLSHILSTNKYRVDAFGTNNPLRFDNRPVAAKTGTTNENRDAWTVGYTPNVAIGVWSGNNDNRPMNSRGVGANASAPIFREFLLKAYPNSSDEKFPKYDKDEFKTGKDILDGELPEIKKIKVCEIPGENNKYCKSNKYCPKNKEKKRYFADVHNILYYVIKDDPQGDKPEHPKDDPQYKNWEKGVRKYYEKEYDDKIIFDEKPKDCKKEDFEKYNTKISLSIPNSTNSHALKIKVNIDTEYGINKIEYFVNDKNVNTSKETTFEYTIPENQNNTTLKIKAILTDKADNIASAEKSIDVSF